MPTSNGSVIMKDARPPDDARLTKALREAGALILGKAAMGEFAGGSYNTIDGQTKNPYSVKRDTGGSSSGSAASVGANFTVLAIGTDTSTSVRGPAASRGSSGSDHDRAHQPRRYRPEESQFRYGRSHGALGHGHGHPAEHDRRRRPERSAHPRGAQGAPALTHTAGARSRCSRGASRDYQDFTQFLKKGALKGARLGVLRDFFGGDPEIDALADAAITGMRELGATLVDVRLDSAFLDFHVRNGSANIRRKADYRFKKDFEAYLAAFGPDVPKTVAGLRQDVPDQGREVGAARRGQRARPAQTRAGDLC